ncbi:SIR2 family protein [Fibrobacter sp. UWH4]|uniref:SIR2 family protein n=1 Tax=Fibrobacter sp. UWH4 TaxID=1896210 RepID=UPI00091F809A|nr:SIR2 family protein [Fibrobacter sp. UWH4]SHL50919.1 SIR2-like domain-containing protein [Fibrobacter sp. UWH4]
MEPTIFNKLVNRLQSGELAFYIGAGFSVPCKLVDWNGLIEPLISPLNLKLKKDKDGNYIGNEDLIQFAQFVANQPEGRKKINEAIREGFSKGVISDNQKELAKLDVSEIWTTNYDPMIENALRENKKEPCVIVNNKDLLEKEKKGAIPIYKVHGDYCDPENCVITSSDYEDFFENKKNFIYALKTALIRKTFIFAGFSFKDPDVKYILAELRHSLTKDNMPEHFWIICTQDKKDREVEYELFKEDLKKNYNITSIEINDFKEIPQLLRDLSKYAKRNRIFISGSYCREIDESDDDYKKRTNDIDSFISDLTSSLVGKENQIVSGYGLGVGSAVITACLRTAYEKYSASSSSKYLIMHPFPRNIANMAEKERLWKSYREEMCDESGIQIVLFGRKINEKKEVVNADGVKKEFDIAHQKGLFIIPIGSTGGMTNVIWNEICKEMEEFGYNSDFLKTKLKKLGELDYVKNKAELVDCVLEIVNDVQSYKG